LERLAPGSWINNDFGVWIGSKQNNHNWYILRKLRDAIEKKKGKIKHSEKVMSYFRIIEGSDWNWWNTFEDVQGDFKKLFLSYVRRIYKLLGLTIPSYITKR